MRETSLLPLWSGLARILQAFKTQILFDMTEKKRHGNMENSGEFITFPHPNNNNKHLLSAGM
jgi:hypothetical protein